MKTLFEVIEQMKNEIKADVVFNAVPASVTSFSQLHDYVDANCYGGFCDDDGIMDELIALHGGRDEHEGIPDAALAFMNAAQDAINTWLGTGALQHST